MLGLVIDVARVEERLILSALREKFGQVHVIDVGSEPIGLGKAEAELGLAVIRPISMLRALYSASFLEALGVHCINSSETIMYSGDKILSYTRLVANKLPVPRTVLAFTRGAALSAGNELGYPLVVKPPLGSWGRLVTRARTPMELEVFLAHREAAKTPHQRIVVMQEHVETEGRDIRCLVVGDEVLGCIERVARNGEWRSNVALGAETKPYKASGELEDLALRAAMSVKGFFVSIDLFETSNGFLVNEVNAVPEFKGFMRATGINPATVLAEKLYREYRK